MLIAHYFNGDGQAAREVAPQDISERLKAPGGVLWLDIEHPTEDDFALLTAEFGFHPLAIEDLKQRDQRPKVIEYGDYVFVVAHEWRPAAGRENLSRACVERNAELHVFAGNNYLVTV